MKEAKLIQYLFQISSELPTSEETVQGLQDCRILNPCYQSEGKIGPSNYPKPPLIK